MVSGPTPPAGIPPQIPYTCDHCAETDYRDMVPTGGGSQDDSARVAGWRIGVTSSRARHVICPQCAGTDVDYWLRRPS